MRGSGGVFSSPETPPRHPRRFPQTPPPLRALFFPRPHRGIRPASDPPRRSGAPARALSGRPPTSDPPARPSLSVRVRQGRRTPTPSPSPSPSTGPSWPATAPSPRSTTSGAPSPLHNPTTSQPPPSHYAARHPAPPPTAAPPPRPPRRLSLGGFQEALPNPSTHRYNTHALVDPSGALRASYRKIHLFDLDIPGKVTLRESNATLPGAALCAAPGTPAGTLGLSVCYDLRFPALFQRLRFDLGADALLVPAAFTVPTGEAHWEARVSVLRVMWGFLWPLPRRRASESVLFAGVHGTAADWAARTRPPAGRRCC